LKIKSKRGEIFENHGRRWSMSEELRLRSVGNLRSLMSREDFESLLEGGRRGEIDNRYFETLKEASENLW
jgi:hypothetical protein